jgi:hypothetical protein
MVALKVESEERRLKEREEELRRQVRAAALTSHPAQPSRCHATRSRRPRACAQLDEERNVLKAAVERVEAEKIATQQAAAKASEEEKKVFQDKASVPREGSCNGAHGDH